MSKYFINIDSSVECKKGSTSSYGLSTVAWTIKIDNYIKKQRAGLLYSHSNGPNKIIYEGILAAISTLEPSNFNIKCNNKVFVYIDSQIVIDQINGIKNADKMKNHLYLVNKLKEKLPYVEFSFSYKNEKDHDFKEVDTLSKKGREWLPKIVLSL